MGQAEVLGLALAHVTQAVVVTDGHGRVELWNPAAEEMFGYSAAEALGLELRSLITSAELREDVDKVVHSLRLGESFTGEVRLRHRNGTVLPTWAVVTCVADDQGRPANFVAVSVDLTEWKAVAKDAQMLASIVTSSQEAILAVDPRGVVTWANAATERVFGRAPAEIVGTPALQLVPPGQNTMHRDASLRLMAGEDVPPLDCCLLRADGGDFEATVVLGLRRDDDGVVLGTSVVVRDVTEQRRLEREVEESARLHVARFEQVALPQAIVDLDGRFVEVNAAACELLGRSREELVGAASSLLVHPRDPRAWASAFHGLGAGGTGSATYEVVGQHADGRPLPLLIDVTVLRDCDCRPTGVAVFARDLTEVREAESKLAAQQALFRALNRRSSDAAVVADADTNIVYMSPSLSELFGYEPEQVLGVLGYDFVHPDDVEQVRREMEHLLATPDGSVRFVTRLKDGFGQWRWVEESVTNCLDDPDIGGLVANLRDITAEVEAGRALRESEARYRAIAETAQEGILVASPEGDVLFANPTLAEIVGHSLEHIYETGLMAGLPPHLAEDVAARLATRGQQGPEKYVVPWRHADGQQLTLSISATPLTDDDDVHVGSLVMVVDVTQSRRAEAELRRQALHDTLTDLPNRTLLTDRLEMAATRARRDGTRGVAVLVLDLDHFKMVNDSRGHDSGDRLLQEVSRRIVDLARPGDTVARLGGDEFAVVCEDADGYLGETVANDIQEALAAPFDLDGQPVYVSASIGVATSPPDDPQDLLRHADAAMYSAKRAGRRAVVRYDHELAHDADRKLQLVTGLRQTLRGARITLHYQPIVDLADGSLLGVESLLRWDHPELGRVPPPEVVAAAEQVGLSLELDQLVVRSACQDLAELRAAGVLSPTAYMTVNVSARNAGEASLDLCVADGLAATGVPPEALMVELTESAVMRDPEAAIRTLGRLAARGVTVAVDDFGTGYSSLAYLQRLPVRVLKIDRSFVSSAPRDPGSLAIAESIIGLAGALDLQVIAEGIETEEQAETMRRIGCHAGQGYLWSSPVPPGELAAFSG